jgi:hypothetical protein
MAADKATQLEETIETSCATLSAPHPASVDKELDFLSLTWRDVLLDQSLVRPYSRLGMSLRAVHTKDPALQAVATSVDQIVGEMQKLKGADSNLCHYIDRWKAMQWDPKFEVKLRDPLFKIFGLDHAKVVLAARRATNVIFRLQRLGLTFTQAVKVASLGAILGSV